MKTKQLPPEQQLDLIESTITKSRENLSHYSFDFVFWGWLILITATLNFIGLFFTPLEQDSYFIWAISPLLGGIYIANYHWKKDKQKERKTYLEFFLQQLWIVLGVVMILFPFLLFFDEINPLVFFPVLAGTGTLVSGLVLRFKPLIFGGTLLLLFPFILQIVPSFWNMPFYGLVVFIAFALPGYALKKNAP